jgi:hypothetical protein
LVTTRNSSGVTLVMPSACAALLQPAMPKPSAPMEAVRARAATKRFKRILILMSGNPDTPRPPYVLQIP